MPNHESVSTPVHIVQPQFDDLPGPQAVGGKQHEDRVVAQSLGRVFLAGRGKNGAYLFGIQERGHRLAGIQRWRDDASGEVERSAPGDMKKLEEATQLLRHILARDPA